MTWVSQKVSTSRTDLQNKNSLQVVSQNFVVEVQDPHFKRSHHLVQQGEREFPQINKSDELSALVLTLIFLKLDKAIQCPSGHHGVGG